MIRETLEIGKIEICLINLGTGSYPGDQKDIDRMITKRLGWMGENGWRFPTKKEFSYIGDLIYNLEVIESDVLISFEYYWSNDTFTLEKIPPGGIPDYIQDLLNSGIEIEKSDPVVSTLQLTTKSGRVHRVDDWVWKPSVYDEGPTMGRRPEARYLAVRDI